MILPADFTSFANVFFKTEYDAFLQSLNDEPPTSIRTNPFKANQSDSLEKIPWTTNGYYLAKRPSFTDRKSTRLNSSH